MWKIDVPPTSELLRLRVLVERNGQTNNRALSWKKLVATTAAIRNRERRRRRG